MSRRRLFALLPVGGTPYAGVSYDNGATRVTGSFAADIGPLTLYGQAHGDQLTVLCLAPSPHPNAGGGTRESAAGLERAMREFDLVLVDWCDARLLDASNAGEFLSRA